MQVDLSLQIHPDFHQTPCPTALSATTPSLEIALPPESSWQTWFEQWLVFLDPQISPIQHYELGLLVTNDDEIQAFNVQYRQVNQPTDVLAFAALEVDVPQSLELLTALPLYLGDIVISVETAHRQAQRQGYCLEWELAWLASHGLLHLLGWDHPDESHLHQMLAQQAELLESVGFQISPEFQNAWGLLED